MALAISSVISARAGVSVGDACCHYTSPPPPDGLGYDEYYGSYYASNDTGDQDSSRQDAVCGKPGDPPISNGPNPCNETKPPQNSCTASSGQEDYYEYEVSGGIDYKWFSASLTSTRGQHHTASTSCTADVTDWCQHVEGGAGLAWKHREVTFTCSDTPNPSNLQGFCGGEVTGTYKHDEKVYCDAHTVQTINCKATCP